jgi:spermidine synthase
MGPERRRESFRMTTPFKASVGFIFLLSGMSGLVYEVLWAKFLVLFIGNTTYAHSLVIAVFMSGLSVGYYFWGRVVDYRPRHALLVYAALEIAVGLYALGYFQLFNFFTNRLFLQLASGMLGSPWLMALKFALICATMILPTFLMGGTLPALTKVFVRQIRETNTEVARLYFLNSLGGVFGCLLAGFYLIPNHGLREPVVFAGCLNLIIGVAAFVLASGKREDTEYGAYGEAGQEISRSTDFAGNVGWLLLATALCGGVAMVYEIGWVRLLSLVLGSATYSFSVMLAAFISGIALGAYVLERIGRRVRRPFLFFGLLQIGIALSVLLTLPLYERLPYLFLKLRLILEPSAATFAMFQCLQFGLCFFLMFLPTTLSGMTLPLVSQLASRHLESIGRSVGSVFCWNTLGTVAGAMLAGLVLLPHVGIERTLRAGGFLSLTIGAFAVLFVRRLSFSSKGILLVTPLALVLPVVLLAPRWDPLVMQSGVFRWRESRVPENFAVFSARLKTEATTLFYKDGLNASVAVEKEVGRRGREDLTLKINGKPDASRYGDLKTQLLLAHIPMLLHPNPRRILVIGFGSGISLGAVLRYPVERVDLVEIEPAVIDAGRFFSRDHHDALTDPRVHLHLDDARTFLLLTGQKYDVIISEPSNPWIAGIGNLFTKEFYEAMNRTLRKGGLVCQWFHSYEMSDALVRAILRTFLTSFPNATLWNGGTDYYLLGSRHPFRPHWGQIEKRMEQPQVREDLARIAIADVPSLLSTQALSGPGLAAAAGEGALNLDHMPLLEYRAPRAFYIGEDATLLEDRDERRKPNALWLSRYREEYELSSENYLHMFRHHSTEDADRTLMEWILEAWLRSFPEDATANWNAVSMWEQEPDRALRHVEVLLEQAPDDPRLSAWKGFLLAKRETSRRSFLYTPDLGEAAHWMRKAIEEASGQKDLYQLYLGRFYEIQGDPDRAIAAYDEALRYAEASAERAAGIPPPLVYRLLAASYVRKKDLVNAERYYALARGSPERQLPKPPLPADVKLPDE